MEFDSIKVKDQLGRPEDKGIFVKRKDETVIVEEGPTHIQTRTLGNAWIVGTATNGIVGINTGTVGGGQQVVGGSGRVLTLKTVVNPNNIFREHFSTNYFEDTGTTTADWADTEGELNLTNGEIAQSNEIAYATGTITSAKIIATASAGDISDLAFQLTADGGSNWENVTHATEHTFTNTGTDLRFKITASGNVTITKVTVSYK